MIKKFLSASFLFLLLAPLASAGMYVIPAPPEEGYVQDEARILSSETEALLNSQLALLEEETSTQMVVATMFDLQGRTVESMALDIAREWEIGQEEFDNGLLFLIAPTERQVRIEVGRGLEGSITDANSTLILTEVVTPNFKNEDYDTGTLEAVYYLEQLARNEDFDLSALGPSYNEDLMAFFTAFGLIFFWTILSFMSQSKSWWAGGLFGGLIGGVLFQAWIPFLIGAAIGLGMDYLASKYLYKFFKNLDGGNSGFFGGGGGSSSSGGGFSGGGGSFGGGGASGSW